VKKLIAVLNTARQPMTFRLLVGTSEEREGIITGCLEATFELTVKTRAASSPEREEATLEPIEGRAP
jgi:hypothetical protein